MWSNIILLVGYLNKAKGSVQSRIDPIASSVRQTADINVLVSIQMLFIEFMLKFQ